MRSCPLYFFLMFTTNIFIDIPRVVTCAKHLKTEDIGTVLYERSDYSGHCWSSNDFTILHTRKLFHDILPKVDHINFENDEYIAYLMDYFNICLESVRKLSAGKTRHLMLEALADTVGGYLQVHILPQTKRSYYAGNIKYRNAKRLFDLFDELKSFLRTNGAGWSKPRLQSNHAKIPPIVIAPSGTSVACNGLITYPAKYNSKSRLDEVSITVPLPFLDDEVEPNSIALPFKTESLLSLYSEKSAFVLVKYYITSAKCIASKSNTKSALQKFNKDFFVWLLQSVQPHLDNEKWYPAFGGVLRIIATIKDSGVNEIIVKEKNSNIYEIFPTVDTEQTSQSDERTLPFHKGKAENEDIVTFGTRELLIAAVVSALGVWLLVGMCIVCYRFFTRRTECSPCESPNTPVAVLYENTDYCRPDTCPSKSRKGLLERLRTWWRNKFGRCPGGCQDEERCLAAISYSSKDTVNGVRMYQRRFTKSTSVSRSILPKKRASFKKVCYTSDETNTNSESLSETR